MFSTLPKKIKDSIFVLVEKIIINIPFLADKFVKYHDEIVENEIRLANISSDDKILHIGCGSIPATSILIVKKVNALVECIDKDARAVSKAKSYVDSLGLSSNICFSQFNAENYCKIDFDVVIISRGVSNVDKVLENIYSGKSTMRVLVRTVYDNNFGINKIKNNSFCKVKSIVSYGRTNSTLLVKNQ